MGLSDASGELYTDAGRAFDAFGKPREGDWQDSDGQAWPANGQSGDLNRDDITTRGFTQHEHLNGFNLIHMNGRAYDYNLGRFLSVDPIIQFPENSQSLNPYSYIMNNPMSGTDPSGYAANCTGTRIAGACGMFSPSQGIVPVNDNDDQRRSPSKSGNDNVQLTAVGTDKTTPEDIKSIPGKYVEKIVQGTLKNGQKFTEVHIRAGTGSVWGITGNVYWGAFYSFTSLLGYKNPDVTINSFRPTVQDNADIEAFNNLGGGYLGAAVGLAKPSGKINLVKKPLNRAINKALRKMRKNKGKTIDDYTAEFAKARKVKKTGSLDVRASDRLFYENLRRVEKGRFDRKRTFIEKVADWIDEIGKNFE
ncbi:MAG: hypothetical protein L3J22_06600 [Xanthomonadales bacterium]|nr:hypothetical protein [Xanthomonadales bacterium]